MIKANQISKHNEWKWMPCSFDLKKVFKDLDEYINLSPKGVLAMEDKELSIKVNISMEKKFNFNEKYGFNWHKSWNLPVIKVNIEVVDENKQDYFNPPNNLHAEITVVKPQVSNFKKFHLLDIGIQGKSKQKLSSLRCTFSSLKFLTTSYNHNEAKFHILISIYVENDVNNSDVLLISKISPPIFVDSRKSARDPKKIKIRHLNSFIGIFHPTIFEKKFIKKESKNDEVYEQEIDQGIDGLFNYFTAANIRDKVKHPLFLSLYFRKGIVLYYNTSFLNENNNENLILKMINLFYKNSVIDDEINDKNVKKAISDKIFLICLKGTENKSKMMKLVEFFDIINNFFDIVIDSQKIPSHFRELNNLDEIQKIYKSIYPNLQTFDQFLDIYQKKKENSIESENNLSSDSDGNSIKSIEKKVKKDNSDNNEKSTNNIINTIEIPIFPQISINENQRLFLKQIELVPKKHNNESENLGQFQEIYHNLLKSKNLEK